MKRRDFLASLTGGAAAGMLGAAEVAGGQQRRPRRRAQAAHPAVNPKFSRICISSWSFHNLFQSTREEGSKVAGSMLALLDFPEMIADRYQVHNLEFVAPHFTSAEPAYLQELKYHLTRAHSQLINIPVDIPEIWHEGGLSDPQAEVRNQAIEASKKWIDIAKTMGARSVRCDPGKMNPEDLSLTIDSYKKLAAHGKLKGIDVLIENHGGVGSEHPEELVRLFKGVGSSFAGALPDIGNFPDEETRRRGLALLFPYAKSVCHAKGREFDAQGNETQFNFAKCVEISKQAKYHGVFSVEFEGPGDPYQGVQFVVAELLRNLQKS